MLPLLMITLRSAEPVWREGEKASAAIGFGTGLTVAFLVYHLLRRVPWPHAFRPPLAALHLVAAPLSALVWLALYVTLVGLVPGYVPEVQGWDRVQMFLFVGIVGYVVVAGIAHSVEASARAAAAETMAARTQLAALRAQLHPHFLFNALHTVVQLIPADPARAMEAAELVAELLRATLEEQRDEVTLDDEWRFVSRYLAIERIRFGDRLVVRAALDAELLDERVPAFALQTLVENAVRHGAAPRVEPTEIVVSSRGSASELTLSVRDSGDGAPPGAGENGSGTGLSRLRERLAVLYGDAARLTAAARADGGFEAVLVVPRGGSRWS